MNFGYIASRPDEWNELVRKYERAKYKVLNLQANITRVIPAEFDSLMDQLELAQNEARNLFEELRKMNDSFFNEELAEKAGCINDQSNGNG